MERRQQVSRSYNGEEAFDFLFDLDDEYQRNILHYSNASSSESENEEDNLMVNIPPLDETLKVPTSLPQKRQKWKQAKGPINSFETAIDENNCEIYVPSIPKNSIESEIDKVPYKGKKSAVSRRCPIAANTSKCAAHPRKDCWNNTSIIEIWKQIMTMEIVNLILH